jgi:uncharacterized protein (TIGR02145 family)
VTTHYGLDVSGLGTFDSVSVVILVDGEFAQRLLLMPDSLGDDGKFRWTIPAVEGQVVRIASVVWYGGEPLATQDETFAAGDAPEIPDPILAPLVSFVSPQKHYADLEPWARLRVTAAPRALETEAAIHSIGWDLDGDGVVDTTCTASPCVLITSMEELVAGDSLLGAVVVTDGLDRSFRFPMALHVSAPDSFTDERNGHRYAYRQIGSQTWMAQNLDVGTRVDAYGGQALDTLLEKYCFGDLDTACNATGGLYQWAEAMAFPATCNESGGTSSCIVQVPHRGICPVGWHIPTQAEWSELESYVQGIMECQDCAGTHLKSTQGWTSANGLSDAFGFAALPSGYSTGPTFLELTTVSYYWSSVDMGGFAAWIRCLSDGSGTFYEDFLEKFSRSHSVRCAKD